MEFAAKIFIGTFVALTFVLGYFFKSTIPYIFCPLDKYEGRIYKGKSNNFVALHIVISLGLGVILFLLIDNFDFINQGFQNDIIRIFSFLIIWLVSFFLIGILIEKYLTITDKEYKVWKEKRIKT